MRLIAFTSISHFGFIVLGIFAMKPKWLTDVNAMSRIMSCEPMASAPP